MWIFGSSGLIKANLKTYFKARSKGLSEDEALEWVIQSRYPISELNREMVKMSFESEFDKTKKYSEKEKIKKLIHTIYFNESPEQMGIDLKFEAERRKISYQIDEIYKTMRKKYEY
jgi:hypothetical protein